MKKFITLLALVSVLALSMAACGGKAKETQPESTMEPTLANGLPASKQPDPTAPVLVQVSLYVPDGTGKITAQMDAVSELTEQALLDKLAEHGLLKSGVKAESFEKTAVAGETKAAGPAAAAASAAESAAATAAETTAAASSAAETDGNEVMKGSLTISGFAAADGVSEEDAKNAIKQTFEDNYELEDLTLTVK